MKTMIAPTDFSVISLNAVNYAADMASAVGTDLSIIHVYTIPVSFGEVAVQEYSIKQIFSEAEEKMDRVMENIINRTKGKIKVNTELIEGDVVVSIKEYCKSVNPYAIVMGSESGNAYERFLFGAKTISSMKKLEWPMIVVPPDAKFSAIKKIGLACDYRKVVDTIPVNEIKDLVRTFRAEFHVLYVSDEVFPKFDPLTVEESGWLQEMFAELKPRYDFINDMDIEEGLVKFSERNHLDLLIVIPKRHNVADKIFQRSHSKRLVLHAHVPVMALHE